MTTNQKDWKRTQVRLPPELHEKLNNFASKEGLSQNNALIKLLTDALSDEFSSSKFAVLQNLRNIEQLLTTNHNIFNSDEDKSSSVDRLNFCLKTINEATMADLSPEKIAELMGYESDSEITNYFYGIQKPSFKVLDNLANFFYINSEWLKNGSGKIFKVYSDRLSLDPINAVQELIGSNPTLESNDLNNKTKKTQTLYLIRSSSKAGEFLVARKYNDWQIDISNYPIHISDQIGAGGTSMLKSLFVTLEILYKRFYVGKYGRDMTIVGCIIDEKSISDMLKGSIHPSTILRNIHNNPWWEDLWDASMLQKSLGESSDPYWEGFRYLSTSIQDQVLKDDKLRSIKEHIHDINFFDK